MEKGRKNENVCVKKEIGAKYSIRNTIYYRGKRRKNQRTFLS